MARAVFTFDQGGMEAQNVFDFTYTGTLADAAQAWQNNFWATLRNQTSDDTELLDIVCTDAGAEVIQGVAENGTKIGSALPSSCAWLVTKRVIGGNNGRFFWPGADENAYGPDGKVTTLGQSDIQTVLDAALASLTAQGVSMMVKQSLGALIQVDALILRPTVGTLRGRLR